MQELKQSTHCFLRVLFMAQSAEENGAQEEAMKTEHINGTLSILKASAFSLNYQWRNDFNPLQCSVRFLFTVVHLPSNQKDIKTEHSS